MREISLSGFPFSLYLSGLRDKLDQANITERVLLPGLDGLEVSPKRHYQPKFD